MALAIILIVLWILMVICLGGSLPSQPPNPPKAAGLKEYLDTHKHKGFKPAPRYYESGDYLTYFFKEDRCLSTEINEFLTIYRSIIDSSLVGFKLNNISLIIPQLELEKN